MVHWEGPEQLEGACWRKLVAFRTITVMLVRGYMLCNIHRWHDLSLEFDSEQEHHGEHSVAGALHIDFIFEAACRAEYPSIYFTFELANMATW